MRKAMALAVLVLIMPLLAGCWDRHEINELGYVTALGIDQTGEKVSLTAQVLKPTAARAGVIGEGGGRERTFWLVTAAGNTMEEAFRDLSKKSPRRLFLGHTRAVIFGRQAAEQGVSKALDFLTRNREMRHLVWLLVTSREAKDILAVQPELERVPARGAMGSNTIVQHFTSTIPAVRLNEFLRTAEGEGIEAILPRIEMEPPAGPKGVAPEDLNIRGSAVFRRDRLVGWLNDSETRGVLWVRGMVRHGVLPVLCPGHSGRWLALDLIRSKKSIKTRVEGDRVRFEVVITAESNLSESQCPEDIFTPEGLKELDRANAAAIEAEIASARKKAQEELQSDVFGLGQELFRQMPREWERLGPRWAEIFPTVAVDVKVKVKVRRTGYTNKPLKF